MLEESTIEYEKVILIGLITQLQDEEKSKEYLDELEFLAYTAGGKCINGLFRKCKCQTLRPLLEREKWRKSVSM